MGSNARLASCLSVLETYPVKIFPIGSARRLLRRGGVAPRSGLRRCSRATPSPALGPGKLPQPRAPACARAASEGAGRRQIPGCGKKRRDPARFSFQEPERRWSSTIGPTRHPAIGTGQGCKLGSRLKAQAGAEALKPHLRCARPSTPSAVIDRWRRLRQRVARRSSAALRLTRRATDPSHRPYASALCIGLMHWPYASVLCM